MQLTIDHGGKTHGRSGPPRSDWLSPQVVVGLVRLADAIVIVLAGFLSHYMRFSGNAPVAFTYYSLALSVVLAINSFQLAGIYNFKHLPSLYEQAKRLIMVWPLVVALMLALGFMAQILDEVSRAWVALWLVTGFIMLIGLRIGLRLQLRAWYNTGRLHRNVVVIGAGEHGRRFVENLQKADPGVNLIGLFDDRKDRVPDYVAGYPVLGTLDDLLMFAREHRVDQVVVALPWSAEGRLFNWMRKLRNLPVDIRLCPDVIGLDIPNMEMSQLGGVPVINVSEKPLAGWDWIVKAVEDRILATVILFLISPVMIAVALAVKLTSKGPILFKQKRYGFNNEIIEVYKFRSMYVETCEDGAIVRQAKKDDDRITRVGRFIRRTSLDELPQFLNVLLGDMSIVGPRPHAVAHNEQYARLIDEYLARHKVKPGITGWAQVNGLRGETDTLEKMERRVQYDLFYIERWSLAFDLRIILLTIFVGFAHPNAY
ncbi:MAG: undecaprenyl-phosphate glucose phosphotransferase [Geminicoccaceae bacterium]|nr:undecaprenyl-phosphate glucose phosphotransferase [Geminicoccaceae bacterium]MCB9944431.1 undecaprenyl-phosphate glucose phosphotransferase [Geminicoccaceae bacterium]